MMVIGFENKFLSFYEIQNFQMSPAVLFTPTLSYYPPASVTKLSTSSLPRINEEKPVCNLNDEKIAYADESFDKTNDQEEMIATTVVYRLSESPKSNNLLRNVSEKHLRFVVPAREFTEVDSLLKNCSSFCLSFI